MISVSTAVFLTVGLNRCCSLNSLHKASWLWIMPLSIKEKQQPYLRRPVIRFYGCRRIAPTSIRLNTVGLGLRTLGEGIVSSVLMSYLHKDWVAKIMFIGYSFTEIGKKSRSDTRIRQHAQCSENVGFKNSTYGSPLKHPHPNLPP